MKVNTFFYLYGVDSLLLISSPSISFLIFNMFKPLYSPNYKRIFKVVSDLPGEETFFSFSSIQFKLCGGEASGSFFSSVIFFCLKLVWLFDLLEFYKGINMHGNEEERTNNIHLDFLKPLTVLHANFIKSRATVTLPILSRVASSLK